MRDLLRDAHDLGAGLLVPVSHERGVGGRVLVAQPEELGGQQMSALGVDLVAGEAGGELGEGGRERGGQRGRGAARRRGRPLADRGE